MPKTFNRVWIRCWDNQLVTGYLLKEGRWFSLVRFGVMSYWSEPGDMGPGIQKAKWYPNRRIIK